MNGLADVLQAKDPRCDVCGEPATSAELKNGTILWTCDNPNHAPCQREDSCGVGS